jgi:hypothetical protein
MSYYAIGIGGTGAKCVESLIQLCAAGLMPDDEELNVLFVDPDGANGSLARASSLLSNYRSCREGRVEGENFLKTPVTPAFPPSSADNTQVIWSPLENGKHQLDNFFNANLLSPEAGYLFNLLFSPEEQKMNLDVGFRGRPAIGAAVMASSVDLNNTEPWLTIKAKMRADVGNAKPVKIMLFGSIFGGTGASGFPTIGTILKDWVRTFPSAGSAPVKLGGVLMLPYFSFAPIDGGGIAANSEDFLLNTQAALQYYSRRSELEVFDSVYVLGSQERLKMREAQIGGRMQQNDPHFAELYAALGAVDFFSSGSEPVTDSNRYKMIARETEKAINWTDLPTNGEELQRKLLQMARFSFAYLSNYHPMLEDIAANGKSYRAPWYINFFQFKNVDLKTELQNKLKSIKEYCENYLLWLAKMEFSIAGKETSKPNLINASSFSWVEDGGAINIRKSFDPGGFAKIQLPGGGRGNLVSLWETMCKSKSIGNSVNGTWHFLNELYRRCGE